MGQRGRILAQVVGLPGFKVKDAYFESAAGQRIEPVAGFDVDRSALLVVCLERRWAARCAKCFAIGGGRHGRGHRRRWRDLPWGEHGVVLEYAPERVACKRCDSRGVELLHWAEPHQRQTKRFQQHLALDAFSMPLIHVATKYGLAWHSVRRAELAAIARWEATRKDVPLEQVGIDEKWLGRRHKLEHKFVTIISNLATGEPIWSGYGRDADTVKRWLATLSADDKARIKLFAMDMHKPFMNAVREDPALAHAVVAHDTFHIVKRAGEAITELRREQFFRAGPELRAVGRGARWLVLRAWERQSPEDQARLKALFAINGKLARAYQVVEELRGVLRTAPDRSSLETGLWHVLYRTEKRANVPMRKLHESLKEHFHEIAAIGEHRPPTGRIEALNTNWEALVRRARGYRDHEYLRRKLRFTIANPVRSVDGTRRFLALGIPAPTARAA
jgi:transposase